MDTQRIFIYSGADDALDALLDFLKARLAFDSLVKLPSSEGSGRERGRREAAQAAAIENWRLTHGQHINFFENFVDPVEALQTMSPSPRGNPKAMDALLLINRIASEVESETAVVLNRPSGRNSVENRLLQQKAFLLFIQKLLSPDASTQLFALENDPLTWAPLKQGAILLTIYLKHLLNDSQNLSAEELSRQLVLKRLVAVLKVLQEMKIEKTLRALKNRKGDVGLLSPLVLGVQTMVKESIPSFLSALETRLSAQDRVASEGAAGTIFQEIALAQFTLEQYIAIGAEPLDNTFLDHPKRDLVVRSLFDPTDDALLAHALGSRFPLKHLFELNPLPIASFLERARQYAARSGSQRYYVRGVQTVVSPEVPVHYRFTENTMLCDAADQTHFRVSPSGTRIPMEDVTTYSLAFSGLKGFSVSVVLAPFWVPNEEFLIDALRASQFSQEKTTTEFRLRNGEYESRGIGLLTVLPSGGTRFYNESYHLRRGLTLQGTQSSSDAYLMGRYSAAAFQMLDVLAPKTNSRVLRELMKTGITPQTEPLLRGGLAIQPNLQAGIVEDDEGDMVVLRPCQSILED